MFRGIDFYSDTLTKPTAPMLRAMVEAEVGDEQKDEDPTTRRLEEKIAELTGHSAALFFPSSTMANQIAVKMHTEPGEEIIGADTCHIFIAEAGGPAIHSGVMSRPIESPTGIFSGDDVRKTFRHVKGTHFPITRLLMVENTTNMGGGLAWSQAQLKSVMEAADSLELKTHLDGARLFNAVVKTGLSAKTIAEPFDSVTVCLSKGLGCPVGAVLAFDRKHYPKVRRLKQVFGGALRQSGILAAAGLYALENHIHRIHEDHQNAQKLSEAFQNIPHLFVETNEASTNMVFFRWIGKKSTSEQFYQGCLEAGVRFSTADTGTGRFRAVTHLNISKSDIDKAIHVVSEVSRSL